MSFIASASTCLGELISRQWLYGSHGRPERRRGLSCNPLDRLDLRRVAMDHRRQAVWSHSLHHRQCEERKGLARVGGHEGRPDDDPVVSV